MLSIGLRRLDSLPEFVLFLGMRFQKRVISKFELKYYDQLHNRLLTHASIKN